MLDATVRALEAILIKEKDLKEAFVCSMLQHPSFSASLIRLLTSALLRPNLEELPAAMVMAQVAATFLNENSKKRIDLFKSSPLWKLLEDFLAKRNNKKIAEHNAGASKRGPLPPQVSEFDAANYRCTFCLFFQKL